METGQGGHRTSPGPGSWERSIYAGGSLMLGFLPTGGSGVGGNSSSVGKLKFGPRATWPPVSRACPRPASQGPGAGRPACPRGGHSDGLSSREGGRPWGFLSPSPLCSNNQAFLCPACPASLIRAPGGREKSALAHPRGAKTGSSCLRGGQALAPGEEGELRGPSSSWML